MTTVCVVLLFAANAQESGNSNDRSRSLSSAAIGFSSDPVLLSGGKVDFPAFLVKKGVEGTVKVRIRIDPGGGGRGVRPRQRA